MMRCEFVELLEERKKGDLTDAEYELIEFIYTWHPLNFSKQDVAAMYSKHGIGIFREFHTTALQMRNAEQEMMAAKDAYNKAVRKYDDLRNLFTEVN